MNEIIFNCLSTSVSSLLRNVRNTLSKMLESSEKHELLLKENLLCEGNKEMLTVTAAQFS